MGRVISTAIQFIDGFTKPSKEVINSMRSMGMAGCGKKAYKTFPEKYKLASVDVGGMTADRRANFSYIIRN